MNELFDVYFIMKNSIKNYKFKKFINYFYFLKINIFKFLKFLKNNIWVDFKIFISEIL